MFLVPALMFVSSRCICDWSCATASRSRPPQANPSIRKPIERNTRKLLEKTGILSGLMAHGGILFSAHLVVAIASRILCRAAGARQATRSEHPEGRSAPRLVSALVFRRARADSPALEGYVMILAPAVIGILLLSFPC